MPDLLSRSEYETWIRDALDGVFSPDEIERHLSRQYPKDAHFAVAELRRRGVRVDSLPTGRCYSAFDLEQIVAVAELVGWLTAETPSDV